MTQQLRQFLLSAPPVHLVLDTKDIKVLLHQDVLAFPGVTLKYQTSSNTINYFLMVLWMLQVIYVVIQINMKMELGVLQVHHIFLEKLATLELVVFKVSVILDLRPP
jgi:hypothetical protein